MNSLAYELKNSLTYKLKNSITYDLSNSSTHELINSKTHPMIKIYGMKSCPDCVAVDRQVAGDSRYQVIDIGEHVSLLKQFLHLRDTNPVFDEAKRCGAAGIPCFVLEDGTVTLRPEEAGLSSNASDAPACNIDGSGC